MSLNKGSPLEIDLELQNFIEAERQVSRFNLLVHVLNDKCWDLCMHTVKAHLEPKTESCLVNCVERFLDTTNFILNTLQKTQSIAPTTDTLSFE